MLRTRHGLVSDGFDFLRLTSKPCLAAVDPVRSWFNAYVHLRQAAPVCNYKLGERSSERRPLCMQHIEPLLVQFDNAFQSHISRTVTSGGQGSIEVALRLTVTVKSRLEVRSAFALFIFQSSSSSHCAIATRRSSSAFCKAIELISAFFARHARDSACELKAAQSLVSAVAYPANPKLVSATTIARLMVIVCLTLNVNRAIRHDSMVELGCIGTFVV
jgi:hypothetical protein